MDGANMTWAAKTFFTTATAGTVLLGSAVGGCARVAVEPIEVKPIHITMDVNIRVQRELDQFFAFEDKLLTGDTTRPASGPATQPRTDARD
jgi:hypothetical protein